MQYRKLGGTYVVRLFTGEMIHDCLTRLCQEENITLAQVDGIGAVDHAVVGLYRMAEKKYFSTTLDEEMEIVSLSGSVTQMDGKPYLHLHAALGREGGAVAGGHLAEGRISVTGEIFVRPLDGVVEREPDENIGINMMVL